MLAFELPHSSISDVICQRPTDGEYRLRIALSLAADKAVRSGPAIGENSFLSKRRRHGWLLISEASSRSNENLRGLYSSCRTFNDAVAIQSC